MKFSTLMMRCTALPVNNMNNPSSTWGVVKSKKMTQMMSLRMRSAGFSQYWPKTGMKISCVQTRSVGSDNSGYLESSTILPLDNSNIDLSIRTCVL